MALHLSVTMHPVFLYLVLLGGNNEKFSGFLVVLVAEKDNTTYSFYRIEIRQELMELGQVRNKSTYVACM